MLCATAAGTPDSTARQTRMLVVTEGETVTVRFTPPVPGTPQQVSLVNYGANGALTPVAAANPTSFRIDLEAGVYERLALVTRWLQGEVQYGFGLDVRRPASPAAPSDGRPMTG